ncbi:MAG: insulinase family protein [Saprospiraceae bacterium]
MFYKFLVFALLFSLTNFSFLSAQELPFDPTVHKGILENGLEYYIQKNTKPAQRAELRLVIKAGSLQEDENQLGLAHFVEHMAFNGTKNFAKNDLVDFLELTGTRFGADLNAYTSFAETVYQLQVRTDSSALLDQGLLILQDWASAITFEAEEIEKERGVVISEWRNRLSPDQRIQQQTYPVVYQGSRFAERLPIGKPSIIENASKSTIQQFYKDWYRPELMAVIVVGDVDIEKMEAQIKATFKDLKNPEVPRERKTYTLPFHEGIRSIVATDKEAPFTQIQLLIKQKAVKTNTRSGLQKRLAFQLYNRMLGARLYELQQTGNPPFTFATSAYNGSLGDTDSYFISAFVGADKAEAGFAAVFQETIRAWQHGFTSTELDRVKKEVLIAAERNLKEKDNRKSNQLASSLVYHFLQDNPVLSPASYLKEIQALLQTIPLAQINDLPKDWIQKDNRTLVITGPEKDQDILPSAKSLETLMDSIEQTQQTPYIDQVSTAPLFDLTLNPRETVQEQYFEAFDVHEWQLENGVKVILKPTQFKADEILMQSFSPGGHSNASLEDYHSATAAVTIASLSGLNNFSSPDLYKKLNGKKVNVGPYINELFEGISGSASPDDLETLFQLTYLHCTAPRFEQTALDGYRDRQANVLKNITINPYYYFANVQTKVKYQDHPRRQGIPTMEDLAQIDLAKAESFYKDRFADASDFTFVFVGNFSIENIKPLILKYLGNLPKTERKDQFQDLGIRLAPGKIDTLITRGTAPKSIVDLTFHGDFDYTGKNRYEFNAMLAVLRIQLREQLREELGGVYGVNVTGFNTKRPNPFYRIGIRFNTDPSEVDTLIQTSYKVIKDLQKNGPSTTDLQKVKETQIQSRIKAEQENSYWMAQLMYRYQDEMPLKGAANSAFRAKVEALTAKDIQQAAQTFFNFEQQIQMVLMPEKE